MFTAARIRLTAWYLLIITCITLIFSLAIYRALSTEIDRFERTQREKIQRHLEDDVFIINGQPRVLVFPGPDPELIQESKRRVLFNLLFIDTTIIILSGIFAYVLSGRTLRPIQEMVDEQHRFISDASHELKTPLTSLRTAFEVYLRHKNKDLNDATTIIEESLTEVQNMQSLSENLLQLAQYESQQKSQIQEKLALDQLARLALKRIEPIAQAKEITIQSDLQKTHILGTKERIVDLMVILLDNAVKYSDVKSTISFNISQKKTKALITVIDTGIGISKKDLPHIFDRFYRSDTARSKNGSDGYGLGLSIAQKIAEEHNGNISVKSQSDKGSTFSVSLPLS